MPSIGFTFNRVYKLHKYIDENLGKFKKLDLYYLQLACIDRTNGIEKYAATFDVILGDTEWWEDFHKDNYKTVSIANSPEESIELAIEKVLKLIGEF